MFTDYYTFTMNEMIEYEDASFINRRPIANGQYSLRHWLNEALYKSNCYKKGYKRV